MYWSTSKIPLLELTAVDPPLPAVRVQTFDGDQIEVLEPRVHGDSLIGGSKPDTGWIFIPLDSIKRAQVEKRNVLRTAGEALLLGAILYGLLACLTSDNCETSDEE